MPLIFTKNDWFKVIYGFALGLGLGCHKINACVCNVFQPTVCVCVFVVQASTVTVCVRRAAGAPTAPTAAPARTAAPAPRRMAPVCALLATAAPTAGGVKNTHTHHTL